MSDPGTWALFGKQLNKQLKNYKKQGQDEENKDEHNEDNKPVEVTHGKDNTDKSVEELTQGEDVPQARIVAYSDSDEEDFKPKKWQAGTGSDSDSEDKLSPVDHTTSEVNVKQRQLIRRPPPGNKVSIEAGPSVVAVAGFCGQHVTPKVERLLVPQTAVRIMMLTALRNTQPKTGYRLELIAMLIGFPVTALRWLGIKYKPPAAMPAAVLVANQQLQALAVPAAAVKIASRLWRIWLIRKRRRRRPHKATAASQANLDGGSDTESQTASSQQSDSGMRSSFSSQQPPSQAQHNRSPGSKSGLSQSASSVQQHQQPPQNQQAVDLSGGGGGRAAQAAQQFPMEIDEMRHRLKALGVHLPLQRFSDAELMRFGYACGLHKAQTADEKAEATEQAVQRVRASADWLHTQSFLPPSETCRWQQLVQWRGQDAEGRPVLVVQVAQACQLVHGAQADKLAKVILSQVARVVNEVLGDEQGDAEQAVVVLDTTEAQLIPVTRKLDAIKALASLLHQHFPARLHQLYLVNTPRVLKWVVAVAKSGLPQETQAKIQLCQSDSDLFPFPASVLDFPAEEEAVQQESFADCNDSAGKRAIRRSVSTPALTVKQAHSPIRRRPRAFPDSKQDEVQGLGKGVDRTVKKKTSSKTIAIEARSHMQMPPVQINDSTLSVVAALTILFTFLAAVYQRFLAMAFGPRQASRSSTNVR